MTDKVDLKGIAWDHPRGYAPLEACSALYEQENGVSITWKKRSLQAFADESIDKLAAEYDIIVLDHPHVGLIAETGCLHALPAVDNIQAASMGGSVESYIWKGEQWAYPLDAACQMAVKRLDLVKDTPSSWQDLMHSDSAKYHAITPLLPVDAFDMMMTLVAGLGEENLPFSDNHFTSDKNGILALQVLKALYRLGPSEAVSLNPIKVLEILATSDEFAYSPCLFGYINYARPGFREHQLTYCDLPLFEDYTTRRGILGGAGIGVSAKTDHREQAVKFAQWVSSQEIQSGPYIENDGQPAHRQTWLAKADDPQYSGFLKGAGDTMSNAWTRPRDEWFLGYVDDVCEIMPDFFLKDRDETAFQDELNALYREHISRRDST